MRSLAAGMALGAALTTGCAGQTEAPQPRVAAIRDVLLRVETQVIEARVPRHATLDSLLRQHEFGPDLASAVVQSAAAVFNPRHLREDQPYRLVRSLDGWLREFVYEIDSDNFLRIVNHDRSRPHALDAAIVPIEKQTEVDAIHGDIDAAHPSLVAAIDKTGESVQLAMSLAEVFSGQVDFDRELQPGDGFDVLFEKTTRDGQFAGYGAILAATFVADGERYEAYRWLDPLTGKAGYYDAEGRSLKRFFLTSPLKFEPRITSHFSRSRLHPVHRTRLPHLGVDYAARHGAPVVAVASGTVVAAGWAGAGGKQVHIRHAGGFETYYLHLSSFAGGIRPGARVSQGDLIGRVGSTGTATGPHLDFRLRKNGAFVDPVRERRRQPPGRPIPAEHMAAFRTAREATLRDMSSARTAEAARQSPDALRANQ